MRTIALAGLILASTPVDAAACHRYSRWYYPWPQRCIEPVRFSRPGRPSAAQPVRLGLPRQDARPEPPVSLGIPIPALDWEDGGDPDELARARLLLRAALENANAH